MKYAIIIEKDEETGAYGAYAPDLPGCGAAADSMGEVLDLIKEAIQLHLEALQEDGFPIPEPTTQIDYVEIAL